MDDTHSATLGNIPNDSEQLPNVTEPFRNVQHDTESFGTLPQKEKTEKHTLTVRQVTRMFENAGTARTERSIVNWCQPNKHGISRLDCYLEPNERRYFITKESVDRAIEEELAKAKVEENNPVGAEPFGNILHDHPRISASVPHVSAEASTVSLSSESAEALKAQIRELEKQLADKERLLEIDRKVQDGVVTHLMHQLKTVQEDSTKRISRFARLTGRLETKLSGLLTASSPHTITASGHPSESFQSKEALYEGLDEGVEDDAINSTTV